MKPLGQIKDGFIIARYQFENVYLPNGDQVGRRLFKGAISRTNGVSLVDGEVYFVDRHTFEKGKGRWFRRVSDE